MTFEQLSALRPDLAFIAHWVREKSQVLDLGCGDARVCIEACQVGVQFGYSSVWL